MGGSALPPFYDIVISYKKEGASWRNWWCGILRMG